MTNPIRYFYTKIFKNFKFLPSEILIPIQYEYTTGKKVDLKNPQTFNEKIQWYKIYFRDPLFQKLADKYRVREYVDKKIGSQYLNQLHGVFNKPEEINFDSLPEKFVLKCVHGSGYNIIVKDKSTLDIHETLKIIRKWQSRDFYQKGKEWSYKNIPRKIVVEAFLEDDNVAIPDYKFFCFDGEIKFIQVDLERKIHDYRCYFDVNWNKLSFNTEKSLFYEGEITKPKNLTEMISVVEKLSQNIPFVRVDLYSVKGKTIFGEMTFYPANGTREFVPTEMNLIIGSYFRLPNKY
ncbi:MAG: ATP-grasp fold amidoligase family protein [Bacteroidota bacterium]